MYINRKNPDMKSVTDQTNEILIVDDIDDNVRLLTSILSSE